MRHALFLLTVLTAGLSAAADKPDFTGNWVCNMGKSKLGKMPKVQSMALTVVHKGEVFHSVQTIDDGNGPKSVESDWFMDGKRHPITGAGNSADKMTNMSRWDGNTLVAERRSEDSTYDEKIRITFSADRKTATEHVDLKSPNGNSSSTLVWEKK